MHVVAQPANGSSTMSPGLVLALMMRSSSASGFWVGHPVRSFARGLTAAMSDHQSGMILPSGWNLWACFGSALMADV